MVLQAVQGGGGKADPLSLYTVHGFINHVIPDKHVSYEPGPN
jgi:hypothetical protein